MNKQVLLFGAGRSAYDLIAYLNQTCLAGLWRCKVVDADAALLAERKVAFSAVQFEQVHLDQHEIVARLVAEATVVVSLLPPHLHIRLAHICIDQRRHLLTASYLSADIKALASTIASKGLLFLYEMGLDPGIDHMSIMDKLAEIASKGGEIQALLSFTGGLVASESDDNPWRYKITWNPRNVVLAGQGAPAQYWWNGQIQYVPYHRIFKTLFPIEIPHLGSFEGYPNRDSVQYKALYDTPQIQTLLRGTLRRKGFCDAWQCLIDLGLTDDQKIIDSFENQTYRSLTQSLLPPSVEPNPDLIAQFCTFWQLSPDDPILEKLAWLGLLQEEKIEGLCGTFAQVLQNLLEKRRRLTGNQRDMIVMQHQFTYKIDRQIYQTTSSLVQIGKPQYQTAMAKTVGLPLAIATSLLLEEKIHLTGLHIPTHPAIYKPALARLAQMEVVFQEETTLIQM